MEQKTKEKLLNRLQNSSWTILFDADHLAWDVESAYRNPSDWHIANGLFYAGQWKLRRGLLVPGELEIVVNSVPDTGLKISVWAVLNASPHIIKGVRISVLPDGSTALIRSVDDREQPLSVKKFDVSAPLRLSITVLSEFSQRPWMFPGTFSFVRVCINDETVSEFYDEIYTGDLILEGGIYSLIRVRRLFP